MTDDVRCEAMFDYEWPEGDEMDSHDNECNECTWCGGEGLSECDDPIQCCTPGCTGDYCECKACDGRGYDQEIW